MNALEIFVRLFLIPAAYILFIRFLPEAKKDIMQWIRLFQAPAGQESRKSRDSVRRRTRENAYLQKRKQAPVYNNT